MAKIIEFPRQHQPLLWKFTSSSSRIMQALKFLFTNMRSLPMKPRRMFVVYELEDEKTVYYLNIGYSPGQLIDAFGEAVADVHKHPDNWNE